MNENTLSGGTMNPELTHDPMAERSLTLQRMLRAAGYVKRDGVATAGIRLVSRLAKEHELRDWPHTQTVEDYDALIEALGVHLADGVAQPFPAHQ